MEASTFSFRYDDYALVTAAGSTIESNPAHFSSRHRFTNGIHGESYGGELSLGWKPQPDLTINTSYSYVNIQLHTQLADTFEFELDELTTPRGTFLLEAEYHFTPKHQLHLGLRHLDAVKYYDIPAYWELDARYAYSLSSNLECALIGKNLLDAQHPEYDSAINRSMTEIQRSLILSITWRH